MCRCDCGRRIWVARIGIGGCQTAARLCRDWRLGAEAWKATVGIRRRAILRQELGSSFLVSIVCERRISWSLVR